MVQLSLLIDRRQHVRDHWRQPTRGLAESPVVCGNNRINICIGVAVSIISVGSAYLFVSTSRPFVVSLERYWRSFSNDNNKKDTFVRLLLLLLLQLALRSLVKQTRGKHQRRLSASELTADG